MAGRRGPKKARILGEVTAKRLVALKRQGLANTAIAVKLGVTESGIRKALRRIGYQTESAFTPVQAELKTIAPLVDTGEPTDDGAQAGSEAVAPPSTVETPAAALSESAPTPPTTEAAVTAEVSTLGLIGAGQADAMTGVDAWDRTVDRVFARMGLAH
jgi:hypothetical protein